MTSFGNRGGAPSLRDIGDMMKAREALVETVIEPDIGVIPPCGTNSVEEEVMNAPVRYLVVRVDGRAFHTLTRNMDKPFDGMFIKAMDHAATSVMDALQGAVAAYVQSDEASIIIEPTRTGHGADDAGDRIGLPFNGRLQKIVSIAAAAATGGFHDAYADELLKRIIANHNMETARLLRNASAINGTDDRPTTIPTGRVCAVLASNPQFDARITPLGGVDELEQYLTWRRMDCMRNAVSGIAQTMFTPKQLHGRTTAERWQMIQDETGGMHVDDKQYWGRLITDHEETGTTTYTDGRDGEEHETTTTRRRHVTEAATRDNTNRLLTRLREA